MNKKTLDFILCNWVFLGIPIIILMVLTGNLQSHSLLQVFLSILFGGGWFIAIAYGFFRVLSLNCSRGKLALWVIGLLWFSVISLPWLYWKHLRKCE